jgi:hypothetical protein
MSDLLHGALACFGATAGSSVHKRPGCRSNLHSKHSTARKGRLLTDQLACYISCLRAQLRVMRTSARSNLHSTAQQGQQSMNQLACCLMCCQGPQPHVRRPPCSARKRPSCAHKTCGHPTSLLVHVQMPCVSASMATSPSSCQQAASPPGEPPTSTAAVGMQMPSAEHTNRPSKDNTRMRYQPHLCGCRTHASALLSPPPDDRPNP